MPVHQKLVAILEHKRREVERMKRIIPLSALKEAAAKQEPRKSLRSALLSDSPKIKIIAEIKRSSPTTSFKPVEFDPAGIARAYESAGAVAVSVVTDARFFSGSPSYIPLVKETVNIPALRKDFIIDLWQVAESAALGADAMLLMAVNFKDTDDMAPLYQEALKLGMEPLVEIHSREHWDMVKPLNPKLVGINNRDFFSPDLAVDIHNTLTVAPLIDSKVALVSESGISTPEDIELLKASGVNGYLIGSSLMKEDDPGEALKKLTGL